MNQFLMLGQNMAGQNDIRVTMTKKDWYSYSGFKFSREQMKWALANIDTLRNGQWPPEHKESGYVGKSHKKQVSHEGNFVKAACIAAEIDLRLTKAGLDGLLLELLYINEPSDEMFVIQHIAYALREDTEEVRKRIKNALTYVSGKERHKRSYSQWLRHLKADDESSMEKT